MIGSESDLQTHAQRSNDTQPLRRVLVVAYYFPPMGLSGVQRVAKFVKYLPDYGWQPTVLTIKPAGYFAYDKSLLREVKEAGVRIHRTQSWDPTRLFKRRQTVALPAEDWRRRLSTLSQFFFIPDNKIYWMWHALRAGDTLLREQQFDAVFSSAPPYTAHLVASRLSRRHTLPLLIDFRDDWVGNPRHIYPTKLHRDLNQRLEHRVLQSCTEAITINESIRAALIERNTKDGYTPRVAVIPQGYDPADFEVAPVDRAPGKMWWLYSGIFYDAQTPDFFLQALAQAVDRHPQIRAHIKAVFVGLLPKASMQLIERLGIEDLIRYEGYVSHAEVVAYQQAADVLWMTIGNRPGAESISTGKLYEYIGTRKPIVALVPAGTAREAMRPYGAAEVVEPDDVDAIERAIMHQYEQWVAGTMAKPEASYVEQFDRRRLAGVLASLLSRSCKNV